MAQIALEVAQEEFVKLCIGWDVWADVAKMDAGSAAVFARDRDIITRGIEAGRVAVDANGEVVTYIPQWTKTQTASMAEMTFKIPSSAVRIDMDKSDPNQFYARSHRYAAAMTGLSVEVIAATDDRDGRVIRALASLALG